MIMELLKHLFKKRATLKYPFEKRSPFKDIRGRPDWDMVRCIGCKLCYNNCPSGAIKILEKKRELKLTYFLDRCLFCGQCEDVCPVKAITMTAEYELVNYSRSDMVIEYTKKYMPEINNNSD